MAARAVILDAVNYPQLLFPDFSLILCGYLLCRHTALDRTVWEPVERLVYYFLFPVLLFESIIRSHLDFGAASSLLVAGLLLVVCGIVLAYALPRLPWIRRHINARDHAASAQIAFRYNSFIALALAGKIAGPQGLLLISVLIGVSVPLNNIAAVWPMARHANLGLTRELIRNPLIIGTAAGLAGNLLDLHIPFWLNPTVTRIGGASLPLGLMAAGAGMQLGHLARARTLAVATLSIRHVILPLLAFVLAHLLRLDPLQTTILLVFSALPTASSCYVLAARMGYNAAYVAGLVTLSTVLGMLSLPFALGLLR